MLVLARKCGESLVIPEMNVVITILDTKSDRVRIGIEAPSGLSVHRREVWERIQTRQAPESKAGSPSHSSAEASAVSP
jgi:carbon storage regulator